MEIVDRYITAVRRALPASLQADVTAELSDSIESQVEEREAALGRPLSVDEASTILKGIGHPMVVASRYRPHQQLIGPALFPFYLQSLKVVLPIALSVVAMAAIMLWASTGDALTAFARVWGAALATFFGIVGILSVIFAAIERFKPQDSFTQKWDPQTLPPATGQRIPRSTSAFELVFNLLFLWLVLHLRRISQVAPTVVLGSQTTINIPFTLGPWSHQLFQALVTVVLAHAIVDVINLVRPGWALLRAGTMAVTHGFLLTVLGLIVFTQRSFVAVASGVRHPEQYASAAAALNLTAVITLVCFALICAIMVAINVRKLMQRPDALTSLS